MIRSALLASLVLIAGAIGVRAQSLAPPPPDSLRVPRSYDSSLTQKYTSDFGYSFTLPAKAKFNPIGSSINKPGHTQMANFILTGGCGGVKIWNLKETQVVPFNYRLLDSIIYYENDSVGVNGKIRTRTYIMDSAVVRIEVMLTAKGQAEYTPILKAMFDTFLPPPNITMRLDKWRFEYGQIHDGGQGFEWERPGGK